MIPSHSGRIIYAELSPVIIRWTNKTIIQEKHIKTKSPVNNNYPHAVLIAGAKLQSARHGDSLKKMDCHRNKFSGKALKRQELPCLKGLLAAVCNPRYLRAVIYSNFRLAVLKDAGDKLIRFGQI